MKILAVIPARGGSKRLPGKNLKILGGKPLVYWTIKISQQFSEIIEVMVTTDSIEIRDKSLEYNALAPWLRPSELATDNASSVDVVLHALDWFEKEKGLVDGILLLQPTSPFRTRKLIQDGLDLFRVGFDSIVSVSPTPFLLNWIYRIESGRLVPIELKHDKETTEFGPTIDSYIPTGGLYLITPNRLRSAKSFITPETKALIVNSQLETLDIDTESDFNLAQLLADKLLPKY